MIATAIFPSRYVQGCAAAQLPEKIARLGDRVLALCDPFVHARLADARRTRA